MTNRKWFLVCIGFGILDMIFVPPPMRGVAGLFIGMAAGYFLAHWNDEL